MCRRQLGDKGRVFGRSQALLKDRQQSLEVAGDQGGAVDPQAGKVADAVNTISVGLQFGVRRQIEPVQVLVLEVQNEIFFHAGRSVALALTVQIERFATGSNLPVQLRRPVYVIIRSGSGLPAIFWPNSQRLVRLGFVLFSKYHRAVLQYLHTWRF